jgi:hypothetical protein
MALRPVPGIRPHGAGQKPEAALSGATEDHRRPHCDPTPLPPAAIPRPSSRTRKVLGHVPAVPTGASSANVQAPAAEVAWNRCRTAPGSGRDRKRCLARGSSLLPDAYSGGIHYPGSTLRVYETLVSKSSARASSIFGAERASHRDSWSCHRYVKATDSPERWWSASVGSRVSPQRTSACS